MEILTRKSHFDHFGRFATCNFEIISNADKLANSGDDGLEK
jgi:hypothetical protein